MKKPETLAAEWLESYGLEEAFTKLRKKLCYLEGAHPSFVDFWTKVEAVLKAHQKNFLQGCELHSGVSASGPCPGCGRTGRECWAMPCLYLEFVKDRPLLALKEWCKETGGTLVSRKDAPCSNTR